MRSTKRPKRQPANDDPLAKEAVAFQQQRGALMRRYKGQFVALRDGTVVGHGRDDEELAARMFKRLGDVPFYIARVENEPTVVDLPSPEMDCG